MDAGQIQNAILRYFQEAEPSVEVGTDLNAAGLLDSLATLQANAFIERTFGVKVPDSELNLVNFHTIESIAILVLKYVGR